MKADKQHHQPAQSAGVPAHRGHAALVITCFLVIASYVMMCDLKGVNTDEGLRLGIINGGRPFLQDAAPVPWADVLDTGKPFAYQPAYFLIQRTVLNVAQSNSEILLKIVNVGFLWLALQGLLAITSAWRLLPRLFLVGVFSFNAYLFMHVLQIREYIIGVNFYIWSSWLVLRLLERKLQHVWTDVAWFGAYGALLTFGFYVQTWVVFVGVAQALFLLIKRRQDRWRFYAHLALAYVIVVNATLPFLLANHQRVDVGRWGSEGTNLWPQLSHGFHLVLAGHLGGHSAFTEFLFWFWPAIIGTAVVLMFARKTAASGESAELALRHQGLLAILSMSVPFAFQIAYFYRVDNLSVWPRYFIIHYFFLFWLLGLAVRYLHEISLKAGISTGLRRSLRTVLAITMVTLLCSAFYQTGSYYRDPFLDTGLNRSANWRRIASELSRVIRPDDIMVVHELINQSALTFSRPLASQVVMLPALERTNLGSAERLIYLESVSSIPERDSLAARMSALGYGHMQVVGVRTPGEKDFVPEWRLLVFHR